MTRATARTIDTTKAALTTNGHSALSSNPPPFAITKDQDAARRRAAYHSHAEEILNGRHAKEPDPQELVGVKDPSAPVTTDRISDKRPPFANGNHGQNNPAVAPQKAPIARPEHGMKEQSRNTQQK